LLICLGLAPAVAQTSGPATNHPLVTIRQFLTSAPAWGETNVVRLQGVVTASLSDKTYFLQDGDAGLYVFHRPTVALRVGEWVEVTGHPSLGNLKPLLDGTAVRSFGMREVPPPVAVSFAEAISGEHHMRLIRIKGRLAEERLRGGRNLVLNAGDPTNSFLADLEALADSEELSRIQPGSLLDLTGVCALRPDATRTRPESLRVFVRSAMDVVVLSGPPWWTRKRMLAALSMTLGTLGLALLWVGTLRRQVRRQTADLRARLEKETGLEQRYRQLFETNPHPMWVHDLETFHFLAVNEAAIHQYGYSRNEFLQMTLRDLCLPEDGPALEQNAAVLRPGLNPARAFRHRKKDGQVIEVEITPQSTEFGGRAAEVALALDVTERRRAEAALRRSEQYRRAIIDAEPECVKVVAADGTLLEMNAAGLAMIEADSFADVERWPITRFVRPEYHAALEDLHRRVMAGGSGMLEFEIEGLKGRRRWLETHAVRLPDADGGGPALLGITRDITERKKVEESLRRSEASLATAQRIASVGSWELDLSPSEQNGRRALRWSDEVFRIFGYKPGGLEVTDDNFFQAVHPEDRELVRRAVLEAIEQRQPYRIEHRIVRPDGSERIVQEYSEITFDPATGRPLKMLGVVQDITERRASEVERLRAFETLQLFIDSVPGYVSFIDSGQRYQLVNPGYEQWFGRNKNEIIGRRLDQLHSPPAYQEMKPFVERVLRGELLHYERCIDDSAGQPHWFDIRYIPRRAVDGTVAGFFALVFDITPQKQAETALRESRERLDDILASLDDVVWSSSADGSRILFLNGAAEAVYGRPREDLYANPRLWLTMIHPEDHALVVTAFEQLAGGRGASRDA
jgi:PAS domain S-box-containing protein